MNQVTPPLKIGQRLPLKQKSDLTRFTGAAIATVKNILAVMISQRIVNLHFQLPVSTVP